MGDKQHDEHDGSNYRRRQIQTSPGRQANAGYRPDGGRRGQPLNHTLPPTELQPIKDILARLEHADLTQWETGFFESITEQTDEAAPWLTPRQREILDEIDQKKGA